MTYQYKTLSTVRDELGVVILRLNRPEQMNAFTVEMANELVDFFERASEDDAVRAIIVTGEGKAFCAGMDLSKEGNVFGLNESLTPSLDDLSERAEEAEIKDGVRDTGGRVTLSIFDCKKPVIAAINGAAVGIGATMTLAMDIRLASEKAKIGFVFGKLGIVPEACSSWFLPRIVGIQQALEWVYSAEIFDEVKDDQITISVQDNGTGMNDVQLQKLFNVAYSQSTNGTNGETGTGLGLLLCQQFVQQHKGALNVSSQLGQGSTFSFNFPLDRARHSAPQSLST